MIQKKHGSLSNRWYRKDNIKTCTFRKVDVCHIFKHQYLRKSRTLIKWSLYVARLNTKLNSCNATGIQLGNHIIHTTPSEIWSYNFKSPHNSVFRLSHFNYTKHPHMTGTSMFSKTLHYRLDFGLLCCIWLVDVMLMLTVRIDGYMKIV